MYNINVPVLIGINGKGAASKVLKNQLLQYTYLIHAHAWSYTLQSLNRYNEKRKVT